MSAGARPGGRAQTSASAPPLSGPGFPPAALMGSLRLRASRWPAILWTLGPMGNTRWLGGRAMSHVRADNERRSATRGSRADECVCAPLVRPRLSAGGSDGLVTVKGEQVASYFVDARADGKY